MDFALSNISIMQIIVFLTVVEEKGFAKAARKLHMTQPAITKSIAKLEQELNLKLFTRTTRSLAITDGGHKLYTVWKPCIEEMQKCYHSAYMSIHQEEHAINIAFINTTLPSAYINNIADQFSQQYPFIDLNIVGDSLENQWNFFFQHKYDIIFIPDFEHYELERLQLPWKWAAKSPVQIMVSKNHKLANNQYLTLDDIKAETHIIIDSSQNPNYLTSLEEMYDSQGLTPIIGKKYNSTNTIPSISKLDGVLLVDDYFESQNTNELIKIPLHGFTNGMICTWNEPFRTNYIRHFIDMIVVP